MIVAFYSPNNFYYRSFKEQQQTKRLIRVNDVDDNLQIISIAASNSRSPQNEFSDNGDHMKQFVTSKIVLALRERVNVDSFQRNLSNLTILLELAVQGRKSNHQYI